MTTQSLSAYVAQHGDDPGLRLLAQTTAALRADANFVAREDDAAAAVFLAEETPVPLAAEAFDQVLGMIEAVETRDRRLAEETKADRIRSEIARLPSPVREAALEALEHERWRFAGLGVRRLPLASAGEGLVELMRVEAGRGVATHAHTGDELTLILTGGYFDGHAHYGPGDVSLAQGDFTHAPKADPGEVCYVLAVSYGPPKLSGLFGLIERASRGRQPKAPKPR